MNATPPRLAGIELGGTKCIAVLGEGERIVDRRVFPTTTPHETLGNSIAALHEWHEAAPLSAIGFASFGPICVNPAAADFGTILSTPKPGWSGTQVFAELRHSFDLPIGLDTDVNAAALAEHAHGAAPGCSSVVYLTIGTGLGGGVLINGRPVHGRMHPEIGHIRIRRMPGDRFAGVCPFHGDCIEGLISGPALEARLPAHPSEMDSADNIWAAPAHDLAELLAQLMLTLSPERIVIGGGVTMRQPHLLARARAALPDILAGYLDDVDEDGLASLVCLPALGDDAGPTGALVLAGRALSA